jgi:PAS domain S-box-containing protein
LILWKAGLVMALTEAEIETFAKQYGVPVVTLEGHLGGSPCVSYENYLGMRKVAEHLLETHGYRKIGFLGMLQHHQGFQDRYRGYEDAMQAYEAPIDPTLARPWFPLEQLVNYRVEEQTLNHYLDDALALGVEAIIGIADHIAYQAQWKLQERGIRVPDEVAIVGFDDAFETRIQTPPITTIRASSYELGYTAAETLIDLIAGKPVPELTNVPSILVVRQSCGCQDPHVTAIAAKPGQPPATSPTDAPLVHPGIISAMVEAAQTSGIESIQPEAELLLEQFVAELTGEKTGAFLNALDDALQRSTATLDELSCWHNVIAVLWRQILPRLSHNGEETRRAAALLQQAHVLVSRVAERTQMRRNFRTAEKEFDFQRVSVSLLTTLDINALMDTLADELPGLGIPSCYLSLFENSRPYQYPDPAPEWARLILAYDPQSRTPLEPGGQRFPARQLIPDEFWPQERACSFVLLSLHFQKEQMGFVLFESGSRRGRIYETLRTQISSALQGALLVQRVQERSAELARQQYILDTFMENVPDSIYFKDHASRFTRLNKALAHHFELSDPADAVGKTDFDFFPEDQARPKYEQEQEIIHTGQPILDLEEPDGVGHWALTTKMPLRDEKGEIIGTFGISRDITEMKQAQAELVRRERLSALGQLTATVAHEIRNPLGTVRTCVFAIGDAIKQEELGRVERALQLAERNIVRCDTIISELLDYTRDWALQCNPTDIDEWLNGILDEALDQGNIPESIACVRELNADVEISADTEHLRRAIINAIDNAVDAIQEKGLGRGVNRLTISTHVVGERLEMRVSDTGCGISADTMSNLFEPLFSTKSFGVGLGLPIIKGIMEQHGGGVEISSQKDVGTTVVLWLPKSDSL